MSFSSETKAELCREKLNRLECVQAEAYGVLLFCNVYTPSVVGITTRSLRSRGAERLCVQIGSRSPG